MTKQKLSLYYVENNDTLNTIAKRFDTTKEEIIKYNYPWVRWLSPGLKLWVPDNRIGTKTSSVVDETKAVTESIEEKQIPDQVTDLPDEAESGIRDYVTAANYNDEETQEERLNQIEDEGVDIRDLGGTVVCEQSAAEHTNWERKQTLPTLHYVRKGDTLWKISQDFGVAAEDIAAINKLKPENMLIMGQRLVIPKVYLAEPGDTLRKIAQKNKTSVQKLIKANNLNLDSVIVEGQEIWIGL